jgi:rhodanese-related sulfurtransferase
MFGRRERTPEVDVAEVDPLLTEGAVLVDVREQYEWEAGHAPQAVHLPMGEITLDNLPEGRPLLIVCHVGGRSAAVTDALVRAEVEAVNVAGGMAAWARSGLAVVTDEGHAGEVV